MRIIIGIGNRARYTQAQVDRLIEDALAEQARRNGFDASVDRKIEDAVRASRITARELRLAWQKYERLFKIAPTSSEQCMDSLLALIPARRAKAVDVVQRADAAMTSGSSSSRAA